MHATKILQSYLDDASLAVMTGDWETFRNGISLPIHIISHDESKMIFTAEELKLGFDHFCNTLRTQKVTDYVRLVESARQLDDALISGSYVSHLIAGSHRLTPPFTSEMTLRLVGNSWRAVSVTNALAKSRWPLVRLEHGPDTSSKGSQE